LLLFLEKIKLVRGLVEHLNSNQALKKHHYQMSSDDPVTGRCDVVPLLTLFRAVEEQSLSVNENKTQNRDCKLDG
jgi:hypothetical protein